jgi:hypothetical protein
MVEHTHDIAGLHAFDSEAETTLRGIKQLPVS